MILKVNDRIRNRKVDFFDRFNVSLQYDAVASTFSFNGFFNPDNPEHKNLYCVSHYHQCTLEHNGELLLTGYIVSQNFNNSSVQELTSIGGYSLPGVLEDCQIPPSLYPIQFNALSLREIADRLLKPFKLKMVVDPEISTSMNTVYSTVTASETQSIKQFLSDLASQRNIILSHNAKGELLFTKAKTKQKPILNYGEVGGPPFTKMTLSFNGQAMHSHITVMKQADADGGNSGESEIENPYVPYVFRPKVVIQNSGDDNDTLHAAKNILASELKNIKLTIVTDRWEIDGKVIKPNNLITVINPDVFLYKKTTWFIESISLTGDSRSATATLTCVLPEVYSGATPKNIFAGINLH